MRSLVRLGAAGLCLLLAGAAHAACSVTATNVNFGSYDVFAPGPLDSTGTVTVSCTQSNPVNVTIAIGPSGTSGGFNPRALRHATRPDRLNYNLFTSSSRSTVWGNGTAGTSTVIVIGVRRNQPRVTTVYGRVPQGQDVSVGSYSDSLVVTITP